MSQTYNEYNIVLEKTNFEDQYIPLVLKTHNYRGEKTQDFVAKRFPRDITAINRKMFTPFHINIINSYTGVTILSSKKKQMSEKIIDYYIREYNKANVLQVIELLMDMTTFQLVRGEDGHFQHKMPKKVYFRPDVKELFTKMIEECIPKENSLSLKAKLWVNNNI